MMHTILPISLPRLLPLALSLFLLSPPLRAEEPPPNAPPFDPAQLRVARTDPPSDAMPASAVIMRLDAKRHFRLVEGDRFSPDGIAEYTVTDIRDDGHVNLLDKEGNLLTIYAITEEEKADYLSQMRQSTKAEPTGTHDHD